MITQYDSALLLPCVRDVNDGVIIMQPNQTKKELESSEEKPTEREREGNIK